MTGPAGIPADLDVVFAEVEAVAALAADPAADGDRVYDTGIGWGVALFGRLQRLEHYHRLGELTAADEARYAQLKSALAAVAPAAARLGLAAPPVPLTPGTAGEP